MKAFHYDQSDGHFYSPDGELLGTGYSGKKGWGRNNHSTQKEKGVGPIPCGAWKITGPESHVGLAAPVFRLIPVQGTVDFGRSGFLIHGNSLDNDASKGCIILTKPVRLDILNYVERDLIVTE